MWVTFDNRVRWLPADGESKKKKGLDKRIIDKSRAANKKLSSNWAATRMGYRMIGLNLGMMGYECCWDPDEERWHIFYSAHLPIKHLAVQVLILKLKLKPYGNWYILIYFGIDTQTL